MRVTQGWFVVLLAVGLSACTVVGPEYHPPATQVPPTFAERDVAFATSEPEAAWWQALADDTLSQLIRRALAENHDLRIAGANVRAARALLGESRFERYPIASTRASSTRERASAARNRGDGDRTQTFYDATLDASWEIDFFGRVRRSIEALTADYDAAQADQRDALVIVAAEVARTYIELRGAQLRLEVARRNAANQEQTYGMTRSLFRGGRGTELDIARAQAQLETTRASIPPLEFEVVRAIHRLDVLVGANPGELRPTLFARSVFPLLPAKLAIGKPMDLLRRRPDIESAERRLAGVTARIGVATADLFPRVSLNGSAGFVSTSLSNWTDSDSGTYSIGPFLSWAAFDLGRVRARIRAIDAGAEAQLAVYEQTVLRALEETENALANYVRTRSRSAHLNVAANASENAAQLARVRYQNGIESFLNVLDAEGRLLEIQDQLARSQIDAGLALVTLYKALGGGWQEGQPTDE